MNFSNTTKFGVWILIILISSAYLVSKLNNGARIESSIIKLLPKSEYDPVTENAVSKITENIGKKVVFLVGHKEKTKALESADIFYSQLKKSKLFSKTTYTISDNQQKEIYLTYYPYRNKLLSASHRELLQQNNPQSIVQQALRHLYNPMNALASNQLENDPFFTFHDFLEEQSSLAENLSIENNHLWSNYNNKHYVFISTEIINDVYSLNLQTQFSQFYQQAKSKVIASSKDTYILSMGAIHHAIAGTNSARQEIATIGAGSIIGILILIFITFKSFTPLLLSIVSIFSSILLGLSACFIVFNEIHIFTLVFGSSLIGVSIDYSFHYFTEQLDNNNNSTIIKNILPGISMGMLTSTMAYLTLAIAPFPGLRQIAVFSATGILAAYCCVLFIYPSLSRKNKNSNPSMALSISASFLSLWNKISQRQLHTFIFLSIIISGSFLYFHLENDDNIRNLQSKSEQVVAEEKQIKNAIHTNGENQFFLVKADSAEKVLQLEEDLYKSLNNLVAEEKLASYQGTAIYLPSQKRQLNNFNLLKSNINNEHSVLKQYLLDIGFSRSKTEDIITDFISNKNTLNINNWLTTEYSLPSKFHWIGRLDNSNEYASIISLYGIKDINALKALTPPPGIQFIDYVDNISALLKKYREYAGNLIFIAYGLIFVFLVFRYSWYKSILVILPPLLAALGALSIAVLLNIKLQYFNLLAVILILGIGIDYTLFFAENKSKSEFTMLAILLSALTTIFSFGLLALSNTPVLHSFGLIVLTGISLAFLLSPIAGLNFSSTTAKTD